jgi:putative Ca2+/H+ antiporter (TMEM165/GDT1 family)
MVSTLETVVILGGLVALNFANMVAVTWGARSKTDANLRLYGVAGASALFAYYYLYKN